jgi:hypothetical protein
MTEPVRMVPIEEAIAEARETERVAWGTYSSASKALPDRAIWVAAVRRMESLRALAASGVTEVPG